MFIATLIAAHVLSWMPVLSDLQKMQGSWQFTFTRDGKLNENCPKGFPVLIKGNQIIYQPKKGSEQCDLERYFTEIFKESDEPADLNRMFLNPFKKPKEIYVCWCEGIYEITEDRIRFCVKYHGQGVEGEAARRWKAPVDFVVREGQGHDMWTFERIKKK